ncbi:carbohydrate ABC transporter permease [Halorussus salinisoli]|uniref:carbohydrate ABC transporter permease n=1 Tax=Halorussus salinisoli TaxID=2558242 RepID=UPI0010C1A0E0|nr:sugar ABC transporter permease [Halorussus salinisoli]
MRELIRRIRAASRRRTAGWGDGDDDATARTDGGETRELPRTAVGPRIRSLRDSEFVRSLPFWLLPGLYMGLFVYGAIGWNVVISLTDWSGFGTPSYANLDLSTYSRMLSDPNFWTATRNTVVLLLVFTGLSLVVGLVLAILIDRGVRFENTFRTIYLLPMSLSFVVTAIFWAWMYNFEIGLVNELLRAAGLNFLTQQWISDPRFKLLAVIFALMWQFSGYCMVVYLAGLRAIPTDLYEAAKVDGASTARMYWRVILPQLRASTTSAAVVLMVFALKAFDFLFVLFGTNPGPSADILAMMMFRQAFTVTNWAYGAAIATILFVLALGVISPYLYLQYKRGEL